jgi:hypothetical protein
MFLDGILGDARSVWVVDERRLIRGIAASGEDGRSVAVVGRRILWIKYGLVLDFS